MLDVKYKYLYKSPSNFSNIIMFSDGTYLTGLYFYSFKSKDLFTNNYIEKDLEIFNKTSLFLDNYFSKKQNNFIPEFKLYNSTLFQKEVFNILLDIKYGDIVTYKDITNQIKIRLNVNNMSNQAIGHAISTNPINIIIPCHRVIGANNNLTGYFGGINNKIELLKLEGHDFSKFTIPTKTK